MLILYFSGTGNSRYIAERFGEKLGGVCHCIEEDLDFVALINAHDQIAVCYPIYGSRVPRIMREFAVRHTDAFKGKQLIIFATQLLFSGDGARVFTDLFPKHHVQVIYSTHFLMPNNVCNFSFLWQTSPRRTKNMLAQAEKKLTQACDDLQADRVKLRGFSGFSRFLGNMQGKAWPKIEARAQRDLRCHANCNTCGLCVQICPMQNLEILHGKLTHHNNCTLCFRCINACPKQAITIMFHKTPIWQHKGIT